MHRRVVYITSSIHQRLHPANLRARGRRLTQHLSNGESGSPTENGHQSSHDDKKKPSSRWKSFVIRTISTLLMVAAFFFILTNHVYCVILVVGIQIVSFREIVRLGYIKNKERKLPLFRTINWYFLIVALYFVYGKGTISYFEHTFLSNSITWGLVRYHFFFSFTFYTGGFVAFVCSLRDGLYRYQFGQFAWTHMALLVIVMQSNFVIDNIFQGLIWFFLPASMIIINDIFAYIFGFFFGRTGLIQLSPRKTWEGFIGAFFSTLIWSFYASRIMAQYQWLICPKVDFTTSVVSCTPDPIFLPQKFPIPSALVSKFRILLGPETTTFTVFPVQLHALIMACFASGIAPFGGFFASGLKRAFKVKDFAEMIPGHGGITDRMDCQFIMGLFSFVYHVTFIRKRTADLSFLMLKIMRIPESEQLELFEWLQEQLLRKKLLAMDTCYLRTG